MKKATVVVGLVAAVAVYLGATLYAGVRIESEMDGFRAALAANENVRVNRIEYERGVFGGQLQYDVEYLGGADEFLQEAIAGLTGAAAVFPVKGTADVRHGPWVGGGEGVALAMTKTRWTLPERFRACLPEYPGDMPGIDVIAKMGFGGEVRAVFTGTDYAGAIRCEGIDPGSDLSMALENWGGTVRIRESLDQFDLSGHIKQLSFVLGEGGKTYGFGADDVRVEVDSTRKTALLWTGDARLEAEKVEVSENGEQFTVDDFAVHAASRDKGGTFDNTVSVSGGRVMLDGIGSIKGLKLDMAVRNVDIGAYEHFLQFLERDLKRLHDDSGPEDIEAALSAVNRFFEAGPSLGIDSLRFHVEAPDDITGHLSVRYPPSSPVDIRAPETMLLHIEMEGDISASATALQEVARIHAAFESRNYRMRYGRPLSDSEIEKLARKTYSQMMLAFRFMPFFQVSKNGVQSRLEVTDGKIIANDREVMDIRDFMDMFL